MNKDEWSPLPPSGLLDYLIERPFKDEPETIAVVKLMHDEPPKCATVEWDAEMLALVDNLAIDNDVANKHWRGKRERSMKRDVSGRPAVWPKGINKIRDRKAARAKGKAKAKTKPKFTKGVNGSEAVFK